MSVVELGVHTPESEVYTVLCKSSCAPTVLVQCWPGTGSQRALQSWFAAQRASMHEFTTLHGIACLMLHALVAEFMLCLPLRCTLTTHHVLSTFPGATDCAVCLAYHSACDHSIAMHRKILQIWRSLQDQTHAWAISRQVDAPARDCRRIQDRHGKALQGHD